MIDINSVTLTGRLTRDSEIKYTASGTAVCNFAIAVNSNKKVGDKWEDVPNFFDVTLWGKLGEALNTKLLKGVAVTVQGELKQERWEQDGKTRSAVKINAQNIRISYHADKGTQEAPQDDRGDVPF